MPSIPGELFKTTTTYPKTGQIWTLTYARVDGAGVRLVVECAKDEVFVSFKFSEQEFLQRITPDIPSE